MAKKRIPYGYRMEKGVVTVDKPTGEYVQKLFHDYINGIPQYKLLKSLHELAEVKGYELPKISSERLKSILENEIYMGDELFPRLITKEDFKKAQEIRGQRKSNRGGYGTYVSLVDKKKYYLQDKIICGECGKAFRRYSKPFGRKKNRKFVWECQDHIVNGRIKCPNIFVTEGQIEYSFQIILNRIKDDPSVIEKRQTKRNMKESARYKAIDREIKMMEEAGDYESEKIRHMILKRAALKYEEAKPNRYDYYTGKIQSILLKQENSKDFDEDIFKQIVNYLVVYKDGRLKFLMKNEVELWDSVRI